ncbi:MAG: STAS domain-containing protein [Candidatus Kapaibacteriota bacterium]
MGIIKIEEKGKNNLVHLEGDFVTNDDINNLRSTLRALAERENNFAIANLAKTNFLSSAALGVLLSANALFERQNGKIVLCSPNDYILNLFKITKLDLILDILPTIKYAEKKLEDYRSKSDNN